MAEAVRIITAGHESVAHPPPIQKGAPKRPPFIP